MKASEARAMANKFIEENCEGVGTAGFVKALVQKCLETIDHQSRGGKFRAEVEVYSWEEYPNAQESQVIRELEDLGYSVHFMEHTDFLNDVRHAYNVRNNNAIKIIW